MQNWEWILILAGGLGTALSALVWNLSRKLAALQTGVEGQVNTLKQGQESAKKEVNNELSTFKTALAVEQQQSKQYREDSEKEQNLLKREIVDLKKQLHEVEDARKADKEANAQRIRELEREIQDLRIELEAAKVRAENEKKRADSEQEARIKAEQEAQTTIRDIQHRLDMAEAELKGRKEEAERIIKVVVELQPIPLPADKEIFPTDGADNPIQTLIADENEPSIKETQ